MKNLFKNNRLCEDVMVEPGKFIAEENSSNENEFFRIIEIKKMSNGHVTAQAVIIQKTLNS